MNVPLGCCPLCGADLGSGEDPPSSGLSVLTEISARHWHLKHHLRDAHGLDGCPCGAPFFRMAKHLDSLDDPDEHIRTTAILGLLSK